METNKGLKHGLKYPNSSYSLTPSEQDILNLITNEFLTLKQIQIRRDCSKQAVYKIVKSLKNKGALNNGLKQVDYFQSTSQPNRLHGQELNIKIISKSEKYYEILKKSNVIHIDNHTIRLYKDSIEIYAGDGISFFGEDETRATRKSLDYWKKFIVKLENEFRVILTKPRVQNIKLVNHHYATINSNVSQDSTGKDRNYKVYSEVDGKLIFLTDNSLNLKEHETVHPENSKIHSENVNKQINDWCYNNPRTNTEIDKTMNELAIISKQLIENQLGYEKTTNEFAIALNRHIPAYEGMAHQVKILNNVLSELKDEMSTLRKEIKQRNIKLDNSINKSLFDFKTNNVFK